MNRSEGEGKGEERERSSHPKRWTQPAEGPLAKTAEKMEGQATKCLGTPWKHTCVGTDSVIDHGLPWINVMFSDNSIYSFSAPYNWCVLIPPAFLTLFARMKVASPDSRLLHPRLSKVVVNSRVLVSCNMNCFS